MTLPEIPVHDHRGAGLSGLGAFAAARIEAAAGVMDAVLDGMGPAARALRPALGRADRVAERWLRRAGDPYLDEILSIRAAMGRPGPVAFSLSYEFGCTTRVFPGDPPVLFRTLDWPFRGLGERIEIVHLSGPAGDWLTATWPGVVGVIHGLAPGRFAAALNQAPERRTGWGRPVDWLSSKRRFWRADGLPPTHLLRRVLETCPDFASARRVLETAPVAAPAIFSLAGTHAAEAVTIERTETRAAATPEPAAANGFRAVADPAGWRARGIDSPGRFAQIAALGDAPGHDGLAAPMLNDLTRLAVTAATDGRFAVTGFDGARRTTRTRRLCWPGARPARA